MTERSAEQAPVQTRPDHQDTARIPLAERLQRRISAASDDRRAVQSGTRESGRVLPPMPAELVASERDGAASAAQAARAAGAFRLPDRHGPSRTGADRPGGRSPARRGRDRTSYAVGARRAAPAAPGCG